MKHYFNCDDVTIVDKQPVFQGFFTIDRYRIRHALFAGGESACFEREIFERGNSACVLLWDPLKDSLVMIEQFRVGALKHPLSPWLIELVAGMVEQNETPQDVAVREAREEAGVEVKRLKSLGSYLSSPGGTTERVWLFIGEVDSSKAGGIHGLDNENEDIRVKVLDRAALSENLFNYVAAEQGAAQCKSRVDNAATIICLQWLALHHQKLLKEWQ
ncbi:MAG TPA: NUDIX domain-containing protein [Aeromonadales bacterium]|nr:NUDIX domain-containing protein [Aeromonadales bacterium]